MCVLIFSTAFFRNISQSKKNWARYDQHAHISVGLHVQCRYSCHIAMKLEFYWQIFKKYANIKFHGNLFSGGGADLLRADSRTDGQSDKTKLIVSYRNFADAPKTA